MSHVKKNNSTVKLTQVYFLCQHMDSQKKLLNNINK